MRRALCLVGAAALVAGGLIVGVAGPAGATVVNSEAQLIAAFSNAAETQIDFGANITLTAQLSRNSATALVVDGHGFTLTQGSATLRVLEQTGTGSLTFNNITITGGTLAAGNGGAISSSGGGAVNLTSSTVTANTAAGSGGGIFASGPVTLTNSTVSGNTATTGIGGGINGGVSVTLTNSTVSGNHAPGDSGGGIHLSGTLTMTNSTISDNDAIHGGGAFAGSGATVTGSTISGNDAVGGLGGGLHFDTSGSITNSTITGNTSTGAGGGVLADDDLTLQYVTIVNNTAGSGGANIHFRGSDTLTSFGSVVAMPLGGGNNCTGQTSTTSDGYNWEDTNTCGFGAGTGDMANAGSPNLGALGSNGGPTQTMAPQTGSGLIDKIPATSPCAGVNITVDQRGLPRPTTLGQFCDIGAFEVQPPASQLVARFAG